MAMGLAGLGRTKSNINVTPLIDVLLVLLIIFMAVTPILTKALQSDIPHKVDQPIPEEYSQKQLVVHIGADGRYQLNQEEITLATLPQRLRDVLAQRGGNNAIFIDADSSVLYGTVVQVMDLCRGAGAETIGVVPDSLAASAPASGALPPRPGP